MSYGGGDIKNPQAKNTPETTKILNLLSINKTFKLKRKEYIKQFN